MRYFGECKDLMEWINKIGDIHTMEYYADIKRMKYQYDYNIDELEDLFKCNKPDTKGRRVYDYINMKC